MEPTLALHIIAKDEYVQLNKIISKYGDFFDEICIAYDDDVIEENVVEDDKVKLFKYEWRDDFAHKRNFLVECTKSSHYFRMDTDDEILNPQGIRSLFKKMNDKGIDVVLVPYIYSTDKDGNCNAKHWRETLIRKSDEFYWNKPVHENIIHVDPNNIKNVNDDSIAIVHNISDGHIESSGRRNFRILLKEFNENKEDTDPRTVAYLGRMLMSFGEYQRAISFLELLVKTSGWDDDKYFAWVDMANCYSFIDKFDIAISCCNEALAINTEFPDAYNTLGNIYILKQDYKKAIHWLSIGVKKPEPKTNYVVDPSSYTVRAPINLAIALFADGQFELAYKLFQKVYQVAPNEEFVKNNKELFETSYERDKYIQYLIWIVMFVKENDPDKLVSLVESIPECMKVDERIQSLMHRVLPAKKWSDNSVVIYCGQAWEEWSPMSVASGIGGSEEAVIYLSKELTRLGYEVTVFNSCGDYSGNYAGVEYKNFYEFNPNDEYNNLIAWRGNVFTGHLKAKNKIVWMHDVPCADQFQGECFFDKVIVLSEYHKSLLPKTVPEDKIFVSSNGINIEDFGEVNVQRNPYRMIYTSSYDRGIENLLEVWGDVKKEVPEAELHLFYGWNTYDRLVEAGRRDPSFKEHMTPLINQEGVFEHGRVGHKKLNKEFAKSKFWVYPSHFEEISCISAMKAQAMGCTPVCTDYAALAETVKDGVIVSGNCRDAAVKESYKNALIKALKEQPEFIINKEQFGWDKVAEDWNDNLLR